MSSHHDFIRHLETVFSGKIEKDVILAPYITLRTKARARWVIQITERSQWEPVLAACSQYHIPYLILGGGSNMALASEKFDGLVIRNQYTTISQEQQHDDHVLVTVGSGMVLTRFIQQMNAKGYGGLEFHFGLPGTIGGAVAMNSKWTHPEDAVGDSVDACTIAKPDGILRQEPREYFAFTYGWSKVQETGEIIIDVRFRLRYDDPQLLTQRSQEAMQYRASTQPKGMPTSGCFFKNITTEEQVTHQLPTRSAGYLIDQAGLKGIRKGAYVVSDKHANFILGDADGDPDDLRHLIEEIRDTVYQKFGIRLRDEVRVV